MRKKLLVILLTVVSLLQASYQVGEIIEDFTFLDSNLENGQTIVSSHSVSQLLGAGKLVMFNFFGTTCASCNQEAQDLRDLWSNWQANQPGKLHLTGSCNAASYTFEQLNGAGWRTKFNPPLNYQLATYQVLGFRVADFTGMVPLNVLIGGGRRIEYIGSTLPSADKLAQALMSVSLYVVNQPADQILLYGSSTTIDLSGSFISTSGEAVCYQIDSVSAPALLTAGLSGNQLVLQAGSVSGECIIRLKAQSGTNYNFTSFKVKVQDPLAVELLNADFTIFPPAGWSSNGWQQANSGQNGKCAIAKYQPAGQKMLTTGLIAINAQQPQLSFYWKNNDVSRIVGHDTTFAEISTDAQNWQRLTFLSATQQQSTFVKEEIDLSAYQNQSVQLRWRYKTDGNNQAYGTALDQIQITGRTAIAETKDISNQLKVHCYPNPFNNRSVISYVLKSASQISLKIYNAAGEEVRELVNERQPIGSYSVNFAADGLNSGLFFYRLTNGNQFVSGKFVLVK